MYNSKQATFIKSIHNGKNVKMSSYRVLAWFTHADFKIEVPTVTKLMTY